MVCNVECFRLDSFFYAHSMQTSSTTGLLPFKLNCIALSVAWAQQRGVGGGYDGRRVEEAGG